MADPTKPPPLPSATVIPLTPLVASPPKSDTEPLYTAADIRQLKAQVEQARAERDAIAAQARAQLAAANAPDAPDPKRQAALALALGKWAVLLPAVGLAGHALARHYPQVAIPVDSLLSFLGL